MQSFVDWVATYRFIRATYSMTVLSPKDMTGLPGAFQAIATYVHGLQTVIKDQYEEVTILEDISRAVYTADQMQAVCSHTIYRSSPTGHLGAHLHGEAGRRN